jgi:hypothetical protein
MVGGGIMSFLVIFLTIWVILYTYNPWFCQRSDCDKDCVDTKPPACPSRAFVAALVVAIIFCVIVFLICAC